MRLLSFESSAKTASVALTNGNRLIAQYTQSGGLTHSTTLLPMAKTLLSDAGVSISDVDAFAVACGPGSFTGIRIGISTVKGLALAANKPCAGVSTLEAMAWHGVSASSFICPVMDARRNQVYNALFRTDCGKPVRICKDRAVSLEELASDVKALSASVFIVGDGAEITAEYFDKNGISYIMAPYNLRMQSAWGVAMASQDAKFGTSQELLPVYLRLSQAERERQAATNKKEKTK